LVIKMVTIVIPEEILSGFANAFMDEKLRAVIFLLQDGPLTEDRIAGVIRVKKDDVSKRLESLLDYGLVRRMPLGEGKPDMYSLAFSMERFSGYPNNKMVRLLSESMSDIISPLLEKYSDQIGEICDSRGIALSRNVEQLLLSSFSAIIEELKPEVLDEDKRICEKFASERTPERE